MSQDLNLHEMKRRVFNDTLANSLERVIRTDERTRILAEFKKMAEVLKNYSPSSSSCNDEHMKGRQFAYIDAGQRIFSAIQSLGIQDKQ